MALQMRHGLEKDFLPDRMVPGEMAVTTDSKKIFVTFAPGDCKRMSTYEDMETDLEEVRTLADAASEKATQATVAANTATTNAQAAQTAAEAAQAAADQAAAVTGVGIATTSTAGIVKPDGNSIVVGTDGTISTKYYAEQVTGNGFTAVFRKQGNIVLVYLKRPGASGSTEEDIPYNTYTDILTIPEEYKPIASEVYYTNFNGSLVGQVGMAAASDGSYKLRIGYFRKNGNGTNLSPSESVYTHFSYFCK